LKSNENFSIPNTNGKDQLQMKDKKDGYVDDNTWEKRTKRKFEEECGK
jgi:hypothetical protein